MKIFIQGSNKTNYRGLIHEMYESLGFNVVNSVEEADFIQFTGGSDVDPRIYKQGLHKKTFSNPERDTIETELFYKCLEMGKNMIGICRGAQLLHVLNGGELYQDVDGHKNAHKVKCRLIKGIAGRDPIVTSTHHQMMMLNHINHRNPCDILMVSYESTFRDWVREDGYCLVNTSKGHEDIEALYYTKTNCLCFQPHPEFYNNCGDTLLIFKQCLNKCFNLEL